MFSILILTLNEEANIAACISSVKSPDKQPTPDIHVLDSGSTDQTVAIATEQGAAVHFRQLDDWSSQLNHALKTIHFAHDFIFMIDADERANPELMNEMHTACENCGQTKAFLIRRRDHFPDSVLKHAQATPFYPRLFHKSSTHFERLVNPVTVVQGPSTVLAGHMDHYPLSKGITHWLERHNSYSSLEARQLQHEHFKPSLAKALTEQDIHKRRRHQKAIYNKLPMRPLFRFLLLYVGRCGFLDGSAGFRYAVLQGIYEYMIQLKIAELRENKP